MTGPVAQVRVELLDADEHIVARWLVNADRAERWAATQTAARVGTTARLVPLEPWAPYITGEDL